MIRRRTYGEYAVFGMGVAQSCAMHQLARIAIALVFLVAALVTGVASGDGCEGFCGHGSLRARLSESRLDSAIPRTGAAARVTRLSRCLIARSVTPSTSAALSVPVPLRI